MFMGCRDVKLDNIFYTISSTGKRKFFLGDYGLVASLKAESTFVKIQACTEYAASPESIESVLGKKKGTLRKATLGYDMWAFGYVY